MVFYRTYRPQKLADLDSETVRQRLTSILSAKDVPHAFLFTGPRGLGKTSSARIVAKIVNCTGRGKADGIEPCNTCDQCTSITNGTNLDVLEIDAASNRGIDEMRDLRDRIKLSPSAAKKKVYIIDEVHMLTTEAFNALLKTLEEPPSHVLFILCTTDPHKIPATIQSRSFHIPFSRATKEELVASLKRIVAVEKITIDDEALSEIAKNADGSFRDASKGLEEVFLHSGKEKITNETVRSLLGNSIRSKDFVVALENKNAKEALTWLTKSINDGLNLKLFLEDFLMGLHNTLLGKYQVVVDVPAELSKFEEEDIKMLIMLFSRAHKDLKTAVIPQLPVELSIIEYCIVKGGDSNV